MVNYQQGNVQQPYLSELNSTVGPKQLLLRALADMDLTTRRLR